MIPFEERDDAQLRCPYCKEDLTKVVRTRVPEMLGKVYLWSCPHCQSVLGVSHRKGFWMG